MSDIAIRVEGLSKRYRIGGKQEKYKTLRDTLTEGALRPFRAMKSLARRNGHSKSVETIWALKDVSFEVKRGEVVGIIGRNGAGKSTLLKILSRITEPTGGYADINGRIASLLEVGTGFHPELTGRENIYLNGSILGMKRAEIVKKFDEIVAFAEIEKFIDTPVKHYSSGMYVRLAFAVAAHLEPDILMVDEVLAVGDAAFQKKCLGKMGDVAREGRTVLFVSHNMAAIQALCSRAILLEGGHRVADGSRRDVVRQYLLASDDVARINVAERTDRLGDGSVLLDSVTVDAADGGGLVTSTAGMKITLTYNSSRALVRPKILIGIYDENEVGIYGLDSEAAGGLPETLPAHGVVRCVTAPLHLTAGPCSLNIALFNGGNMADYIQRAAEFTIEPADFYGTGRIPSREWTIGLLHHEWSMTKA